jgi:hypothetical protein
MTLNGKGATVDDGSAHVTAPNDGDMWEYKVMRVFLGPVAYQKYGPDTPDFEGALNEYGKAGWEAFHVQAVADSEVLLLFLKRRLPPAS